MLATSLSLIPRPLLTGNERSFMMNTTTTNPDIQYLIGLTMPADYLCQEQTDELLQASADDEREWVGYEDWSRDVEQAQFEAEQERRATVETEHGSILMVRDCGHTGCKTSRCERSIRLGGIEI